MVDFVITPIVQSGLEGSPVQFTISVINPDYTHTSLYKISWRTNNTATLIATADDYDQVLSNRDLFFGPTGPQSYTISINTKSDWRVEGDEKFEVDLYRNDGGFIVGSQKVFTILDAVPDIWIPSLSVSGSTTVVVGSNINISASVGNQGKHNTGAFVTSYYLSHTQHFDPGDPSVLRLGSPITISDLGPESSPKSVGQSLFIPANVAPGDYWIGIVADTTNAVAEPRDDNNSLSIPITVTSHQTAEFGITTLLADHKEGSSQDSYFTFVVTRTGDLTGSKSVSWSIVHGGTNDSDFSGDRSGTLTFGANGTQILTIQVKGDLDPEPDETFTVQLTAGSGAILDPQHNQATGTIHDDDAITDYDALTNVFSPRSLPDRLVDILESFRGQWWADMNCVGLVWAVSYEAGIPLYGQTDVLLGDHAHVVDANKNPTIYKTPDASGTPAGWAPVALNGDDWASAVRVGDYVRINVSDDEQHAFIVTHIFQTDETDLDGHIATGREIYTVDNLHFSTAQPSQASDGTGVVRLEQHRVDPAFLRSNHPSLDYIAHPGVGHVFVVHWSPQPTGTVTLDTHNPITTPITATPAQQQLTMLPTVAEIADWVVGQSGHDVVVTDNASGTLLLTANGFSELIFRATDLPYSLQVHPLSNTDVAAHTVYFDGGAGNDNLDGTTADKPLVASGGAGDDILIGGVGDDVLSGGDGHDTLAGGAGSDLLIGGSGGDLLMGGAGADTFSILAASDSPISGPDQINDFQSGVDKIDLSAIQSSALKIAIADDVSFSDLFYDIDGDGTWDGAIVLAGAHLRPADINTGTDSAVGFYLFGFGTADSLIGGDGPDLIYGGLGKDTIDGGAGQDLMFGGGGADIIRLSSVTDSTLSSPDFVYDFATGQDTLDLSSLYSQTLKLAVVTDGTNSNVYVDVDGDGVWDALVGFAGAQIQAGDISAAPSGIMAAGITMFGSPLADTLIGGDANDVLSGDLGDDTLDGGAGDDIALFSGRLSSYTISAGNDEGVTEVDGPDGIDHLRNIEFLQFTERSSSGTTIDFLDLGNQAPWALQTIVRDAAGNLLSQTIVTDGGSRWVNTYGGYSYSDGAWTETDGYDAAGTLVSSVGAGADGTHWLTLFDAPGAHSWQSATVEFDASWNWISVTASGEDTETQSLTPADIAEIFDTSTWFTSPYDPNYGARLSVANGNNNSEDPTESIAGLEDEHGAIANLPLHPYMTAPLPAIVDHLI